METQQRGGPDAVKVEPGFYQKPQDDRDSRVMGYPLRLAEEWMWR